MVFSTKRVRLAKESVGPAEVAAATGSLRTRDGFMLCQVHFLDPAVVRMREHKLGN